ncbi:imelysin family protein [Roseomonas eburnea]|uniref:Imelysin family protein n=1 Tax=Neoroseomonas eburnea TaxID=1346889 RepID=A0A9X9XDR1_9PROT|nr:imelysin family protein [Neoroseomonas eburnea]MBR0681847.1 imelysin family protein [Neoroseomonas eburnea]
MPNRRTFLAAALLVPASAHAQPARTPAPAPAAQREALRRAVATHILPRHAAFAEATRGFAAAAATAAHGPAQMDAARTTWIAAALAFQGIRHLRFGPMEERDRGFRIAFFPDVRNSIGREMAELLRAADPALVSPEAFARGRVAAQGLPAAERLLFGDEAARLAEQRFRGTLLGAIGANLAVIARDLETAWTRPDAPYGTGMEGTPDGPYRSPQDGLLMLFKSLSGGLEFLAERQVARTLGPSLREAFPRRAEAWRSGQSLALVRASLAAQQELWAAAFAPMLAAANPTVARQVAEGFARSAAAAGRIVPSLESAVVQAGGRAAVEELLRALGTLRRLLGERGAPALGLPMGFNSMDGD